jgi:hypothetical protein
MAGFQRGATRHLKAGPAVIATLSELLLSVALRKCSGKQIEHQNRDQQDKPVPYGMGFKDIVEGQEVDQ